MEEPIGENPTDADIAGHIVPESPGSNYGEFYWWVLGPPPHI